MREAARQILAVALQAEVSAYIDVHAEEVDENCHRLVVRNGHHNEREVITAAGPVPVRAPRVNDKRNDPATGERKRFASAILPAWARKSPRVAFYGYPAEHWIHLRTTNPIESTFATVRLRQRVTKGPGSRAAGVAMAFKLIESAQTRWRAVNAPHLVALVRAGAVFKTGKLIERPNGSEGGDQQVA